MEEEVEKKEEEKEKVELHIIRQATHVYVIACSLRIIHIYKLIPTYNNTRLRLPIIRSFIQYSHWLLYQLRGGAFMFLCIHFDLHYSSTFAQRRR